MEEVIDHKGDYKVTVFHNREGYADATSKFLFNQSAYLDLHSIPYSLFYLIHQPTGKICARIGFQFNGHEAISLSKAPFGSIEVYDTIEKEALTDFIRSFNRYLKEKDVQSIYIKHFPAFYENEYLLIKQALLDEGWQVAYTDRNFHIPLSGDQYESIIHDSTRRRLEKCRRAGFTFHHDENISLEWVHEFVTTSRAFKNYPVNISETALDALFANFPEQYNVYTVQDGEKVIALTCTVQTQSGVLYSFLPAHDPAYQTYSPVIMLYEGLYYEALQKGYHMLDLGDASENGAPIPGLERFKRNLGASVSDKPVFWYE